MTLRELALDRRSAYRRGASTKLLISFELPHIRGHGGWSILFHADINRDINR
jgi:hypothetical protein